MSVFIAVILLMLALMSFLCFNNMRNTIVDNRLNTLTNTAREIAYLSATNSYYNQFYNQSLFEGYLKFKISQIQEIYNAYIVIIDSSGKIIDNFHDILQSNKNFAFTLDKEKVLESLNDILKGNEIRTQNLTTKGNIVFSIGVPYKINNDIRGAVFIHTASQIIHAGFKNLFIQSLSIFLIVMSIFGIIAAILTKKIIDPLENIENAVHNFSEGHYNIRAKEQGSIETKRLAKAFNFMASNIEASDKVRKEFVANVSHELRSPVTNINGYINGILDNTIPSEKIPYYLNIVSHENDRLKKLIENLLDLSRMESESFSLSLNNFDINEAIRVIVINRMGEIEKRGIKLELNFETEKLMVFADRDKILQILTNLLDNALKFVDDNTGIIAFQSKNNSKKAIISIKDNGIGIKSDDIDNIFKRFYKVDKSRNDKKGTGLGLSICRQICELHNEKIYAVPCNDGAHFEFTLKLSDTLRRAEDGQIPTRT